MKMLRHFIGLLRSHGGTNQVALGFCVGMCCGIIPCLGFYLSLWALLIVVFRLSLPAFFLGAGLFKYLGISVLHPLAYRLGHYLLEDGGTRLNVIAERVCSLPLISLMELERYLVLGSLVFALVLLVPIYFMARMVYQKISGPLKSLGTKKTFRRLLDSIWGDKPFKANSMVRGRLVVYVLLAAFFGTTCLSFFSGILVKKGIEKWATAMVGTEVQVQDVDCNLFQGKVLLHSLTVRDPVDHERQIFSAGLIELDMGLSGIAYGQLILEKIGVKDAVLKLSRDEDGSFNFTHLRFIREDLPYYEKAREKKAEISLSAAHWEVLESTGLDWLGELYKCALRRRTVDEYKNWRRLQMMSEYGKNIADSKLQQQVLQSLSTVYTLGEVESLLHLTPEEILLLVGRAGYIEPVPPLVCCRLSAENVQIQFALDREPAVICSLEADNFALYPDNLQVVQYRSPISGKASCREIALSEMSPLWKESSPVAFTQGKLNIDSNFTYHTSERRFVMVKPCEDNLSGYCELSLEEVQANVNPLFSRSRLPMTEKKWDEDVGVENLVELLNSTPTFKISLYLDNSEWQVDEETQSRLTTGFILEKGAATLMNLFESDGDK